MLPHLGERTVQLLLSAALKGTLVLLVAWGWIALFKRTSASIRHWICSLALLSTLLIPVATLIIPVWSMPILPGITAPALNPTILSWISKLSTLSSPSESDGIQAGMKSKLEAADIASSKTLNTVAKPADARARLAIEQPSALVKLTWPILVLLLWGIGVALTLGRWLVQAQRIRRITLLGVKVVDPAWNALLSDLARKLNVTRPVALILSDQVSVPLTWGARRPAIVLPESAPGWAPDRRQIVLAHEMAHIARWDYVIQWITLISCAANWYNPVAWRIAQHAAAAREHACDDQVLALGTKSSHYATSLLEIAHAARRTRASLGGVLAMGQGADLAKRIRRILDVQQSRHPLTLRLGLTVLLLLAVILLPFSTVQFSRASAQNPTTVISVALPPWEKNNVPSGLFKNFESAHPGVSVQTVEAIPVPDPVDGLDAYFTAVQKYATSADVLFTQTFDQNLAVVPHGTRAGYFLDLAPLVSGDKSLNVDDFYPAVWRSFQWDKGIWALPISSELAVLSYDPAQFDRAGLAYPNNKWTFNDFVNAVTKLATRDANNNVTAPGFTNTGRIFRLSLWQSLLDVKLFDENVVPSQPQFAKPSVEAVVDAYYQLGEQGLISGNAPTVPMYVSDARHALYKNYRAALLPGGRAGLLTAGFAVSAGTQHPDLAYDLAKYLTTRGEANLIGIPARKSLVASTIYEHIYPPELKPLVEEGLANGLTFADMRFTSYLNAAYNIHSTTHEGILAVEARAISDLKAADAKKGTLTLNIKEPELPVLPPGKIALTFQVNSVFNPLPTRDQWDRFIKEFTASDPQVALVDLRVTFEPPSIAATKSDCFYYPGNIVPSTTGNTLLNLDPFLNADASFDKADFVGSMLAAVQRDNKTYALPIDLQPAILRYDPARWSAANLPAPANNWRIENFVEALKALKTTAPDSSPTSAPFVDVATNGTYLLVLIAAYGGVPIDYRTNPLTVNFTAPATVTAIRQTLDLARSGYIRYGALGDLSGGPGDVFPNNTTAIYPSTLDGPAVTTKVRGIDPNKPVLFPAGREFSGLAYNLGAAYISAQAPSPDACYRFISAMSKRPELFQTMPARRSVLTSTAFKAATNPDLLALYNQVDALLKDPRTVAFPAFDKGTLTVSNLLVPHWLYEAFDKYVLNNGDLDAALKEAEAYAKGFLGCTANLPPLTLAKAGSDARETTNAYLDCAIKVDGRLKPILESLYVR